MSFFEELFGRGKLTARDLRAGMLRVERERRKKRLELKKLETRQTRLVDQIKEARKSGNNLEVDYLWEDLKGTKLERAMAMREATVLNLEAITVKKYMRGMQRLEKRKDQTSIDSLLRKLRTSGLQAKLEMENLRTEEYLDELRTLLDDAGLEDDLDDLSEDDPEKAAFLAEIDAINAAEERGDVDDATEKESELKAKLESENRTEEELGDL